MKYEAVFGDQALLEDAETAAGLDVFTRNVTTGLYGCCRHEDLTYDYLRENPVIAMRRIIPEPKRWTAEDQKAGRLPEVGCKCVYIRNWLVGEIVSIDDSDLDDVEVCLRFKDKSLLVCKINSIKPIETPDEKAARLRSEWCSNALGSASILSGMQEYELKRLGGYIGNIYDAILSGELPVPGAEDGS